jgi:hypothetical protein
MALTLKKLQRLEDAELTGLYTKHEELWTMKAENAYDFTKVFVQLSGNRVRPDDVLPLLRPTLDVCDELRDFLADRKLRNQFWFEWFAELIIDRLWTDLQKRG